MSPLSESKYNSPKSLHALPNPCKHIDSPGSNVKYKLLEVDDERPTLKP